LVKGLWPKAAHRKFSLVVGKRADSLLQTKRWVCRFEDGDRSCEIEEVSGRPLSDLMDGIRQHIKELPLTFAKVLAKHFNISVPIINRIFKTHLGLPKFSRKSVLDELTDGQKQLKGEISEDF
jgi:hypothetical protein